MATKTAPKRAPGYRCTECGWTTVKWVGRCGECQSWGTVEEIGLTSTTGRTRAATVAEVAPRIADVDATLASFRSTGVRELDRVLGGGLVPGAVILLAGEPGIGKSTLLLDVAAQTARGAGGAAWACARGVARGSGGAGTGAAGRGGADGRGGALQQHPGGVSPLAAGQGQGCGAGMVKQESLHLARGVAQPTGDTSHAFAINHSVSDHPHCPGRSIGSEAPGG